MKKLSLLFAGIIPCLAQQPGLGLTGQVQGTLQGEDGTAIVGGYVSMVLVSWHGRHVPRTNWTVLTGAGGSFQFSGLAMGQYRLCAQAPRSTWLNPCEWGLQPVSAATSAAQPIATVSIMMKRGAVVPVRMDDPGQLLLQHEGRTSGARVLVGVHNDGHAFLPAPIVSRDNNGRDHHVMIPFNKPVNLVVHSPFFQLADAAGVSVPMSRSVLIPLKVSAGQQPTTIRFTVTAGGRP